MNSFWKENNQISFEKLDKDIECDVLVIGGGIAGILQAYELKKNGFNVILVEKTKIGMGITKNTTATITFVSDTLFSEQISNHNIGYVKDYIEISKKSINEFKKIGEIIDCDFENKSCIYFSFDDKELVAKEYQVLKNLGVDCNCLQEITELPLNAIGGVEVLNQAECNPLKLIYGLSKGLNIYENTEIVEANKKYAKTKNGKKIKYKYVIIATHYPRFSKEGLFFTKMYQKRSFVNAINYKPIDNFYIEMKSGGIYIRGYDNSLLIGGYDYHVGECIDSISELDEYTKTNFSRDITNSFQNQDLVSLDNMPYIGRKSLFTSNMYVITGLNGNGFINSMCAALIIPDLIKNKENKYDYLFGVHRRPLLKPLLSNLATSTKNLLAFGGPRCTHMGCKLRYNHYDKTYECMCHGSRFSKDLKVKNDPAFKNMKQ